MTKSTDMMPAEVRLYFIPVQTRVPLKFGAETLTEVVCARVRVSVRGRDGRKAEGWGETPLSVQWAWPSTLPFGARCELLKKFCLCLTQAWAGFEQWGHPMEIGYDFLEQRLPSLLEEFRATEADAAGMPWLAALVCSSAFDLALHDAYGQLHARPIYETYTGEFMSRDLGKFLSAVDKKISFQEKYPADFLLKTPENELMAWHLVGGLDPLEAPEAAQDAPRDGYPVLLRDWIVRDGLKCLKIKLRGTDAAWDYERLARVGRIAQEQGVEYLSADFNCTVREPGYVNRVLDRLRTEFPWIYERILYVEQPFPYDLEENKIDVHSVSGRKPLFLDESAHDWRVVRLGRELGWTGVALKTCKTQTGAILSGCWAKAHGMALMVQDLTNPMLAQIPHVLLAKHFGTIKGVETNAMQFYPDASLAEEAVHPGIYRRRRGRVHLESIAGPGFGYRVETIRRGLPEPALIAGGH